MVKRYNFNIPNSSYEEICESGDYVDYEDYETLLDKYSDLQVKYEWIVKALADIYKDA